MKFDFLSKQVQRKRDKGHYRQVKLHSDQTSGKVDSDRHALVNFASNDYLGLNGHPQIIEAYQQGLQQYGSSSSSSPLITGYSQAHQYLERQLSEWLGAERCLLFSSGFSANSGLFQALLKSGQLTILFDRLSHASMLNQMFHFAKHCQRFHHNDYLDLNQRLQRTTADNKLVAVEGVYSMDGDRADVSACYALCKQHDAALYIDDAHGIGVIGEQGQGSAGQVFTNVPADVTQMVTFGKALATSGAAIAGSQQLIEYLTNYCGEYIFSTAMSAANAAATSRSIDICQQQNWRREKLQELRQMFLEQLSADIKTTDSNSPVIGIFTGSEENTLAVAETLRSQGYIVSAIRPPTVEPGKSRLRVTLSANHNPKDISGLATCINQVMEKEWLPC
ncbi:8-amino-7-oxononanoate synthase [Thalassotalea litorea]|uniref:8-amino-7-oxononanoate synthase n=1 Tax=Thalassotalea litorea TaxID=2020715 RepID=A0A5R9IQ63_9GAMM|nr:8-amino-7-oxononanoate synthase [Thalassotalea litorea]TLU66177.1 8-amino-7-oxononanoate synthase [Thalassotalea litorea]